LQRLLLFEKKTKIQNACRAFNCSASARNGRTRPCLNMKSSDARAIHHRSILLIGISTCAGRACYKKNDENKQTQHHIGTCAGQYFLLLEGPTRSKSPCSETTITNDAQCIHHFCSRDQLAESRNAITCALTFFVLTSFAIRHAARETTRRKSWPR
jgi:hypothetical protein